MDQSFRETLYTVNKHGKRNWVYSSLVPGKWWSRRVLVGSVLLAIYLLTPWLKVSGEQMILLSIPDRKFVFFGATFWATDTTFIVMVLGGLGILLFFVTSVFGRLWCGWACPETVFLEYVFRPIERLIEGSPAERLRLDSGPWTGNKIFKKGIKYLAFVLLAWLLANTFVAYFVGSERLLAMMGTSPLSNPVPFLGMTILTALMLFQFGWFREQFCTILCPYARFQSVLMDTNSITVGYEYSRGEPRAKLREANENRGDCIDCGLCVRVCPTGIDIRNGLQLECISCTACIDACDSVMAKINRPSGLIRYATENTFSGNATRILRPRVFVYATILVLYLAIFVGRLSTRKLSEYQIVRAVGENPFSVVSEGKFSNHFNLHLSNKSRQQRFYHVSIPQGFELITPLNPYPLAAGKMVSTPIFVAFGRQQLQQGKGEVMLQISDGSDEPEQISVPLLGPE